MSSDHAGGFGHVADPMDVTVPGWGFRGLFLVSSRRFQPITFTPSGMLTPACLRKSRFFDQTVPKTIVVQTVLIEVAGLAGFTGDQRYAFRGLTLDDKISLRNPRRFPTNPSYAPAACAAHEVLCSPEDHACPDPSLPDV
jgi:hypothetical protein